MRTRPCLYGCTGPTRLYLGGNLCDQHAPPAPPTPPPGTTLADRRPTGARP